MSGIGNFARRVGGMILNPSHEWSKIAGEDYSSHDVFVDYVLPLAMIGPVFGYIGGQIFGYGISGFRTMIAQLPAAVETLGVLGINLVGFLLLTIMADSLAERFGGEPRVNGTFKLVAYAVTPLWVSGFFGLVPVLAFIVGVVAAAYCLRLFYLGAPQLAGVPKERALGFTVTYAIIGFAIQLGLVGLAILNMRIFTEMGLLG